MAHFSEIQFYNICHVALTLIKNVTYICFPTMESKILHGTTLNILDKIFKSGLSKVCGTQPLENLKGYGLLKQTMSHEIF